MMDYRQVLKRYYRLAKPGIIYGNLLTAVAGYLYATGSDIDAMALCGLAVGLALTIAGACAANNYLDRGIDSKMKRTRQRALVIGSISPLGSIVFATTTTLGGLSVLFLTQNRLTFLLVVLAWLSYVIVYGLAKRNTVHSTLIGTFPGALPLVTGYMASMGRFDLVTGQLLLLMVAWQMAHFYGIALYRKDDYRMADLPIMPVVHGERTTRIQAQLYIIGYLLTISWMMIIGSLSLIAGGLLVVVAIVWLGRTYRFRTLDSSEWGKRIFMFSLIVVLTMSIVLVANPYLPL